MAKQINNEVEVDIPQTPAVKTVRVRNRNNYKVELYINGKVVVFPPRKAVVVEGSFSVPSNIGLYIE